MSFKLKDSKIPQIQKQKDFFLIEPAYTMYIIETVSSNQASNTLGKAVPDRSPKNA